MRTDPIRPNFYQSTGGYAWQLAEYLQCNQADDNRSFNLSKSVPPKLPDPLVSYPEFLAAGSSVRWSAAARITHNTPQIVGARGIRSSLVVVESTQAFGGFRHGDSIVLERGTTAGSLSDIEINGKAYDAGTLLVTLHRHGFIETDEKFPTSPPTRYMIEPTCALVDAPGIGRVAINQLNGRTIRLSETSQRIFDQDNDLEKIPKPLHASVIIFVEAGMLRLISREKTIGHD